MLFTKFLILAAAGLAVANPLADLEARATAPATCAKLKGSCASMACCKTTIHMCNANKKCVKIPKRGAGGNPGKGKGGKGGKGKGSGGKGGQSSYPYPSSPSSSDYYSSSPYSSGGSPSDSPSSSSPSSSSGGSSGGSS